MSRDRIQVSEIGLALVHGRYKSTFRYWYQGDCACGAKRVVKYFDHKPTVDDMIDSIL